MKLKDLSIDELADYLHEADWDCNVEMYEDGDGTPDDFGSWSREELIEALEVDGEGEETLVEDTIIGYLVEEDYHLNKFN